MLQHLQPISKNHSISKVVATIFVPQEFLKPKSVFEELKLDRSLESYQKKNLINTRTINLTIGTPKPTEGINKETIRGFVFEEYNKEGRLKNIFKLENEHEKRAKISLENRIYEDWDVFFKKFKSDLDIFRKKLNLNYYIDAISLTYIDEFIWSSSEDIPVNEIFNIDSELLNKKFLNSKNGTMILFSQNQELNINFEERTEISFSNRLKRIVINHQYAKSVPNLELYSKLNIKDLFDEAHNANKSTLKDLLSKNTQNLISLK